MLFAKSKKCFTPLALDDSLYVPIAPTYSSAEEDRTASLLVTYAATPKVEHPVPSRPAAAARTTVVDASDPSINKVSLAWITVAKYYFTPPASDNS